ncbi:MAG: glycosyltransferase family 2 protein [bacterium]|nr:glycosyltransferase family 2 protein [bacterium]
MSKLNHSISIIMPAYNEEGNIEKAILSSIDALENLTPNYEVIVVNDGSIDNTEKIANDIANKNPLVKVLSLSKNEGMGTAVRLGIKYAKSNFLFITCADNQFNIAELYKFLPPLISKNADIVIGTRINREYTFFRMFNTKVYNILIWLLFGIKFKDPSWVKLYHKYVFDKISITSKGFFWDIETLIKAKKANYRIEEVDVSSYPRTAGVAQGSNPLRIIKTFFRMLFFWLQLRFSK